MGRHRYIDPHGLLRDVRIEHDRVTTVTHQPTRDAIMERTARMRLERDALRHMSFGGMMLIVPLEDLEELRRKYPDLNSRDGKEKTAAWRRLAKSREGRKYSPFEHVRARAKRVDKR